MGLWLNAMLLRVKGQACCRDLCPLPPAYGCSRGAGRLWPCSPYRAVTSLPKESLMAWGFSEWRALTPGHCPSTLLRAQEPETRPGCGERARLTLSVRLWSE